MPDQSEPNQHIASEQIVSEYVFLNHEDETVVKTVQETPVVNVVNGEECIEVNGEVEQNRQPQNGAEAYENLVKSLTECDNDYMKDMPEDAQMEENFGLIDDGTILETFGFTRETGLFQ